MSLTLISLAILSGAFIGAVLGFVGAGGAMVSVPILIYIFDFETTAATTAALAVVFLAALSGLIPKWRIKDVLVKEALVIWAIGLITNIGFSLYVDRLPKNVILIGFSLVITVAAVSMLRAPITAKPEQKMSNLSLILLSLIIGSLTGLFGIGGGFLAIPVLVLFYNTAQNKAAGTSLLIISLNCFTAFIARIHSWNEVSWQYPIIIALVAVMVAQFAAKVAPKAPTKILKTSFAYLLFAIAIFNLWHAIATS